MLLGRISLLNYVKALAKCILLLESIIPSNDVKAPANRILLLAKRLVKEVSREIERTRDRRAKITALSSRLSNRKHKRLSFLKFQQFDPSRMPEYQTLITYEPRTMNDLL